jgi:hypothetical protein
MGKTISKIMIKRAAGGGLRDASSVLLSILFKCQEK